VITESFVVTMQAEQMGIFKTEFARKIQPIRKQKGLLAINSSKKNNQIYIEFFWENEAEMDSFTQSESGSNWILFLTQSSTSRPVRQVAPVSSLGLDSCGG